jgi:beta-glucosidase
MRECELPKERLSDMVRRILRSIYAVGVDNWGPAPEVDMAKHNEIALEERTVVLQQHNTLACGCRIPGRAP